MLLLSGNDLRAILRPRPVIEALRQSYEALAASPGDRGQSLAFSIESGSAHVKAGLLPGSRAALAAKINVNLPDNMRLRGLPTIQGALLLSDTTTGAPLALMDSIALTGIRTAATAMLAARYGAIGDPKIAAVIGCGAQARYQAEALMDCYALSEIRLYDIDEARARQFAEERPGTVRMAVATSADAAVDGADICVTCTTSKTPVLAEHMNLRGCFIAAVGADNPQKCEISPALMARSRIIVDDINQCMTGGDVAHALKAGAVKAGQICDLAGLAGGQMQGRRSADELVIFDSTGSGVQDVAAAWLAFDLASKSGAGERFDLGG